MSYRNNPLPQQTTREGEALRRWSVDRARAQGARFDAEARIGADVTGGADITFPGAGQRVVYHHLGRDPKGFIVIDRNANVVVWRAASDDKTITLEASGACTIRVEVF